MGHFLRISATSLSRVARHPSPPSKAGIQGVPEKQSDPRGGRRSNDPKLTPRTCASDHQTVCLDVVLPKEPIMSVLTVGTRSYQVNEHRVRRQAERMFKMTAEQRAHRLDSAKNRLARSARDKDSAGATAAAKEAAAILLSQGIKEI